MNHALAGLKERRSRGVAFGLCSVCSAHPSVVEAAVRAAARTSGALLIEATANQVNQHGGYTGLTPETFSASLTTLCEKNNADPALIVFGGDHVGPYPWRSRDAAEAMVEAEVLVRQLIRAGAQKIHLDASMPLGGDQGPALPPEIAARRAATLCSAAEEEWQKVDRRSGSLPAYVIGTEVPVPGGEATAGAGHAPVPTRAADFHDTVELHRRLFHKAGLDGAWERVIAVVVQPGVEFDSRRVFPYEREKAEPLSRALGQHPGLCFECHSTDYQSSDALRAMVQDGFGILKVGPELTFTMREAMFGLAAIEEEMLGDKSSRLRAIVLQEMRADPRHWEGYYPEDASLSFCLAYAYSDRMRYYWNRPSVAKALARLFENLGQGEIPAPLVSQFLPHLCPMPDLLPGVRTPKELVFLSIQASLNRYMLACASRGEGG